jgi:hypothetical protein
MEVGRHFGEIFLLPRNVGQENNQHVTESKKSFGFRPFMP